MILARKDVARALEALSSENLALRLQLAALDPAQGNRLGPELPDAVKHAHRWTPAPRDTSDAGFARDAM